MKKILTLLLLAVLLCTVSCDAGGSVYITEDIIREVPEGDPLREDVLGMLRMLSIDSADIPEFDTTKEALSLFRDSLLNYMCCENYRKYAGNSEQLAEINEKNPGLDVTAAIPAKEFESEMYRYFGGDVKIVHRSTALFTYLERSDVYVPVTAPIEAGYDAELTKLSESENSLRVEFACSANGRTKSYSALVVKREDGSMYFDALICK